MQTSLRAAKGPLRRLGRTQTPVRILSLHFLKSMQNSMRHSRPWLRAFWNRAYQENVTGLSAMVAYNLMLAVFPFALLVLFVFGQVLRIKGVEASVLDDLERLFPNSEQTQLTDI